MIETFLIGLITGIIATLIAGNPLVRFKVEKFIRDKLGIPLIFVLLSTKEILCNDGLLLLHGIKIINRMWFTPKLTKCFCNAPTTLNWRENCNYFGDVTFKLYQPKGVDEVLKDYLRCNMERTTDPGRRALDIPKIIGRTVEVITEPVDLQNEFKNQIPLNHVKKVGPL
jgi:hypothetical protein